LPNFSQIFLCSGFPYVVGLPLSSTTSVSGAVLFNVFVLVPLSQIKHRRFTGYWK